MYTGKKKPKRTVSQFEQQQEQPRIQVPNSNKITKSEQQREQPRMQVPNSNKITKLLGKFKRLELKVWRNYNQMSNAVEPASVSCTQSSVVGSAASLEISNFKFRCCCKRTNVQGRYVSWTYPVHPTRNTGSEMIFQAKLTDPGSFRSLIFPPVALKAVTTSVLHKVTQRIPTHELTQEQCAWLPSKCRAQSHQELVAWP